MIKEFKQELSRRERESRRRTEQREAPGDRPGSSSWNIVGGIGATFGLVLGAPVTLPAAVAAAVAGATGAIAGDVLERALSSTAAGGAGGEETIMVGSNSQKIDDVRKAIDEDKLACLGLYSSLHRLENCVTDFAVFCRDHIDSVLSSDRVDGEFRFLLSILRGTHSPGASANTRVALPTLLDEEVIIHDKRVSTLMDQLERSTANQEAITEEILHNMKEGPNDEEIRTMTMKFIETKFAKACKSEL